MAGTFSRLAGLAAFATSAAGTSFIPAASPLVLWAGRPFFGSNGSVAFDWESTACSFAVAGVGSSVTVLTNITLPLGHASRVSVFVNGYDAANLMMDASTSSYLLATAMPAAVNNVTVHYAFEPGSSGVYAPNEIYTSFLGFSTSGSFVPLTPLSRRIDVVGDSITAGSMYDKLEAVNGQLSLGTGCAPWAPVTGYSQAYNWETYLCRYFQANCSTIAWSGKGLIHNSGCSAGPLMPQLYTQTFGTDANMAWDFTKSSRPDAVIVFLGTNDYSCANTTDAAFTAAYVQFMQNITAYYAASPGSSAPIQFFCTMGAMAPTKPLNAVLATIAAANAAGLKASLLDMRNATTLDGCGGHPGPIGHWEMALLAAPQIEAVMGW